MKKLKEVRELLIVVDMVNGFIREGVLANRDAVHIIPKQINLINKFIEREQGVVFIKDTHVENSIEFKIFPSHCLKGTSEAELIDELKEYEKYGISIEKNSTSFMFSNDFQKLLLELENLKKVYVVGVCSDICVFNGSVPLKNYFDQHNKNVDIFVVEDSVETFNSLNHDREMYWNASKLLMEQCGIKIISTIDNIEWSDISEDI